MFSFSNTFRLVLLSSMLVVFTSFAHQSSGHEISRKSSATARRVALAKAKQQAETPADGDQVATLDLELWDGTGKHPLAGLVRITNLASGKEIELKEAIHRGLNWHSVPHQIALSLPQTKLRIDALHGIQSELVSQEIDLTGKSEASVQMKLPLFYAPRQQGLVSGNTHLHLNDLSFAGAMRYLELVPASDGLDVVFVSHLRRTPDDRTYITNVIVENDLAGGGEFKRLSKHGVLFGNGEEHRHNIDAGGEGYGHVMLLNLKKLIMPVSIGPGIMREGTDGVPVQRGIREARDDGATIVWCHGHWGWEGVPNWLAGLIHAQNIFDGGSQGDYEDTFYDYLNLGMKIPFSTGTDWFIYDFSRVYLPVEGKLTTEKWLSQLSAGRSYITNGTFLEFEVDGHKSGDTISLAKAETATVQGRAVGRNDFGSLELVSNGEVVHSVASKKAGGHFEADLKFEIKLDEPGWLALRVPRNVIKNELDKELFAHTSPIYVELAGQRIFRPKVARQLLKEVEANIRKISSLGVFDAGEEQTVLEVHQQAITTLQQRIVQEENKSSKQVLD